MVRIPKPLTPGDTVGVVAASGPVDSGLLESGLNFLRDCGFSVLLGRNVGCRTSYLAGTDDERACAHGVLPASFHGVKGNTIRPEGEVELGRVATSGWPAPQLVVEWTDRRDRPVAAATRKDARACPQ